MVLRPRLSCAGAALVVGVSLALSIAVVTVGVQQMSVAVDNVISDADDTAAAISTKCESAFSAAVLDHAWLAVSIAASRLEAEVSALLERQVVAMDSIGKQLIRAGVDISTPSGLAVAMDRVYGLWDTFASSTLPAFEIISPLPPWVHWSGHSTIVAESTELAPSFSAVIVPTYTLPTPLIGFIRYRGPVDFLNAIVSDQNLSGVSWENISSESNPSGNAYTSYWFRGVSRKDMPGSFCQLYPSLLSMASCPDTSGSCGATVDLSFCELTLGTIPSGRFIIDEPRVFVSVLAVPLDVRIVNPLITNSTSTSDMTHGRGLGVSAQPSGNPFANCSEASPCATNIANFAHNVTQPVYDDTWGYLRSYVAMNPMTSLLQELATSLLNVNTTNARRDADGCPSLVSRMAMVDHRMQLVGTSEGAVVSLTLPPGRVFLRELATANDANSRSAVLGAVGAVLPANLDGDNATYGNSYRAFVSVPCGDSGDANRTERFMFTVVPIEYRSAVCPRTPGYPCHSKMWLVAALPEAVVLESAIRSRETLAEQSTASAATMREQSEQTRADALVIVICVAASISVALIVVAAVIVAMFARRVQAFARVLAAASTLDAHMMVDALASMGATLVKRETASGQADLEIPEDMRDIALRSFLSFFREQASAPIELQEMASLRAAFAALFTTVTSLSKYVPAEVIEKYRAGAPPAMLGMAPATVVVMFADVANFTTICERTPPDRLLPVMSQFFGLMSDCVSFAGGAVDKFIGDCVMGLWNEGEHTAFSAVVTAVNMVCCVRAYAPGWVRMLHARSQFQIRVGMHWGAALVGNIGSATRFNYTAIGDVVNAASRLEAANKVFGSTILFSESIALADATIAKAFPMRLLGAVSLKGKAESIRVYSLFGFEDVFDRVRSLSDDSGRLRAAACVSVDLRTASASTPITALSATQKSVSPAAAMRLTSFDSSFRSDTPADGADRGGVPLPHVGGARRVQEGTMRVMAISRPEANAENTGALQDVSDSSDAAIPRDAGRSDEAADLTAAAPLPPVVPGSMPKSTMGHAPPRPPSFRLRKISPRTNPSPSTMSAPARVTFARPESRAPLARRGSWMSEGSSVLSAAADAGQLVLLSPQQMVEDVGALAAVFHEGEWKFCEQYSRVVEEFIRGDFRKASQGIADLVTEYPDDAPALVLRRHADELAANPPIEWFGVLSQKDK
eukprot:TRINITY_DN3439_c1_g1_i1.p1 TRINITY_DN3439_c1_g1~~TRINITY_DN3439_c1_g1_i1.p1  ORF type:complete len:1199 (+),score=215.67 TRINITY_DN3439_c1_g1_i1:103-3699(+)